MTNLPSLVAAALLSVASTASAGGDAWWSDNGALGCLHCRLEAARADPALARDGRFDAETGRNLLNYPPHRFADYEHMRLELVILDMNAPSLPGVQTLTLRPIARDLETLTLRVGPDPAMQIASVRVDRDDGHERACSYTHEGESLVITFEPRLVAERPVDVVIDYILTEPREGLAWTPESPAWPGRPAQLHTQGQPESNHYWFPAHDSPNERLTTELAVTVPRGFTVSSNGRLVSSVENPERPDDGTPASTTFSWLQDKAHAPYLVTLVVGKFDIVDLGDAELPLPVYVPPGRGSLVEGTYGRTPEMMRLFERLIDEPYPWDRYAQLVVWNFAAGGMENTSATTMYDTAVLDETSLLDGDLDGLISHELAHQWFGDLITCNSWEHIWLNEGFATYFTDLWFEERDGPEAYQFGVWENFVSVIGADKGSAPLQPPMCSKEYGHPWEVFRRAANPYPKGAAVLHMLRRDLGDDLFFRSLAVYVDRFKGNTVETADLRKVVEEVSGRSFERFFHQWCYRPGVPRLEVTPAWDAASRTLTLNVVQTQTIDGSNPAFLLDLAFHVETEKGKVARLRLRSDTREASISVTLDSQPRFVAADPDLSLLAEVSLEQAPRAWADQLTRGPSLASRLRAVRAIEALPIDQRDEASLSALRATLDDRREHRELRAAAARALGKARQHLFVAERTGRGVADARVRRAAVEGFSAGAATEKEAAPTRSDAVARLAEIVRDDPSYAVRAAAVRGLGALKSPDAIPVVLEAAETESQHDQIRQAALDALASLDLPEGLDVAVRHAAQGTLSRTRPVAAKAIGALAHHGPDRAFNTLAALLTDSEPGNRTVRAAGEALVQLGDPRALPLLESHSQSSLSAVQRDQAARWAKELRAKLDEQTETPGESPE